MGRLTAEITPGHAPAPVDFNGQHRLTQQDIVESQIRMGVASEMVSVAAPPDQPLAQCQ